jgi:hypothetical protein
MLSPIALFSLVVVLNKVGRDVQYLHGQRKR